jgi:hypothetical protein
MLNVQIRHAILTHALQCSMKVFNFERYDAAKHKQRYLAATKFSNDTIQRRDIRRGISVDNPGGTAKRLEHHRL